MDGRRIIVKIDPMGNTVIEADGFAGQSCTDATQPIEQALVGGQGIERVFKDEWEQAEDVEVHEDAGW